MIQSAAIKGIALVKIQANPQFTAVTPELETVVDAIANGVADIVNAELALLKTQYNLHTHVTAVGPTAPPLPPMA